MGTESLTYYDMVGPHGVIEAPDGTPYPGRFPSLPDTAYPLTLVLAVVCSLRGARVLDLSGFDPLHMAALACQTTRGRVLLLANLTPRELSLDVNGLGETARLWVLDVDSVRAATANPRKFLHSGRPLPATAGNMQVHIGPYACAWLDSQT